MNSIETLTPASSLTRTVWSFKAVAASLLAIAFAGIAGMFALRVEAGVDWIPTVAFACIACAFWRINRQQRNQLNHDDLIRRLLTR